jgi:2,4-dienoyl-CoA reductase-like NADH-dependent reductase (Old Yellow Enzyme family)/thioredoxin reductase
MKNTKFKHLFTPVRIGRIPVANRLFASPQDYPGMTYGRFLTEEAAWFYERKALGGHASVCVGDMMVDGAEGRSHPFQMRGDDLLGKANLTRTSMAIARHGSLPAIELVHAGKNANIDLMPVPQAFVLGPSADLRPDGIEVREMGEDDIQFLIDRYADAAALAKQCGFKMIVLHGGHGWQLAQFLSPRDNQRKDRWGGSVERRTRFPLAVIEAVRRRIGAQYPIEFRMSVSEALPDGYDTDEGVRIAQLLDDKVDLINASIGHHEIDAASMVTMPSMFFPDGFNLPSAAAVKKAVNTLVSTVAALTDPEMMEEAIASGQADIIELGRQTLADPDVPIKALLGKEEEITPCCRCFHCFSTSTVGGVFYCAVNPEIGREAAYSIDVRTAPRSSKRVLVVGGGVGGMQAALTACEQGHEVVLCEKTDCLGGPLLAEEQVPFKVNLMKYLRRQADKIRRSRIELHLSTEVTTANVEDFRPDVIIAALGARPIKPHLVGIDRPQVFCAEEIYRSPEKAGDSTVIIGGGLVGLELSLFLSGRGQKVTVVEIAERTVASPPPIPGTSNRVSGVVEIPNGYPVVQGIAIREEARKYPDLSIHTSIEPLKITDEGLLVSRAGETWTIPAKTVIYAVGLEPLTDEAQALAAYAPEFSLIGDAVVPDNIYTATSMGYTAAMDLGRH